MNNTSTGSVRATNKLIPELRFPDFKGNREWNIESFGKLYSFKVTNSFTRDDLNYDNGSVKNIHYGDIHTKFSTLFDIRKEIVPYINSSLLIEKIKLECYCEEGDMIFADASEDLDDIGKSIEIVCLNNEKLTSGMHTLLARQLEPKVKVGFGGYLFKSNGIRTQIQKEAQGTKVLGISITRLSNIKIYYPQNKDEQQKIASCLSSIDELITTQSQKLETLKTHKKGLMQQLFPAEGETLPKLRFTEFNDKGEWGVKCLGKICDVRDGTHDSPNYVAQGYPLITSKNLLNTGMMDFANVSYLTREDYTQINKRSKVDIGDILFGMIGTIGNPVIVKIEGFAIKNVALIKDIGKLNQNFLVHQLKSDYIQKQFEKVNAGGILKFIALGIIRNLKVIVPSAKEQQKIADCLSSIDELITAQTQKIEALKMHKKGLMQQLFPVMVTEQE
ncbi:MAG: restriction endonuclease subunit S [Bacteroidales bacterium]